ncbi:MFS transporter [Micromonospora sp. NPDC047730]|uniref:MFS transporter n=1 Tax=unclassified Micromonospora TaxID=2617518 RepID=UPI003712BD12
MRTYADLFAVREFRNLFLANCAGIAAHTTSALALGALTYASTGSALLTALSMFGAPLAGVLGSLTLLSAADNVPPRRALTLAAVLVAAGAALQVVPGLPLWARFAVVFASAYVGSITAGARWALLTDILPADAYVLGRSTLNTSVGAMQIAGFGLAGVLLAWLTPYEVFLLSAVLRMVAAAVGWCGISERPARTTARTTVGRTLRVNRELWTDPGRRSLLLNLWVPGGLVVGCEALFVPYAGDRAGFLYAAAALGMLAGDIVVGRSLPPATRDRLVPALRLLLALPYLAFALSPALPLAMAVAAVASAGFAAGLPLQERLIAHSPAEIRGQVLGLHHNGMLAAQALCAVLAGAVADLVPANWAVTLLAAASLAATLVLTAGLRRTAPAPVEAVR